MDLRLPFAIHWFYGSSTLEYSMTTCRYGPPGSDNCQKFLLISSNEVLSHVFAIVRMASQGPPFQTPLTISHGQPQTGGSTSTHMVSHRLEVPHQFIWSAFHYATRPLPFIKQPESTTLKGKIPQTAEFRRQRHGQVHPGATGGSTVPDASAAV